MNVVEVQVAKTDGTLVKFGPGRTIVTLQFRRRVGKGRYVFGRKTDTIIVRLVLVSDVSEEFPRNTSSIFTVRLPEPLQLDEGEWEVGLLSLAMPDAGLWLDELTAASADCLFEATYLLGDRVHQTPKLEVATFSVSDLTDILSIMDGVGLMKTIVGLLEWMQAVKVQLSNADVLDVQRPTFHREGEDLILECKDAAVASQLTFKIQTTFAQKMGWLVKTKQGHWMIGPNLNYVTEQRDDATD